MLALTPNSGLWTAASHQREPQRPPFTLGTVRLDCHKGWHGSMPFPKLCLKWFSVQRTPHLAQSTVWMLPYAPPTVRKGLDHHQVPACVLLRGHVAPQWQCCACVMLTCWVGVWQSTVMSECGFFSVHVTHLVGRLFMMTMWKGERKSKKKCYAPLLPPNLIVLWSIDKGI